MKVCIDVDRETAANLAALSRSQGSLRAKVAEVLESLVDHAQQGVYRPGAWERGWVCQAFGDEWLAKVTPDLSVQPNGFPIFDRPKGGAA